MIATRRDQTNGAGGHRTTFVNLWRNTSSVFEAGRVADAIASTAPAEIEMSGSALLTVDGQHIGELVSVPTTQMSGEAWYGVQFARADLIRSAYRLLNDGEVWIPAEQATGRVPLCRLDALGEIGPDRRRLVDGFDRTDSVTAYPMVEGHETEERGAMNCNPDRYLSPLPKPRGGQRAGYGDHLWGMAGRLLVAERLWLNTTRVVAMRADQPVLSNVFWPVKTANEVWDKALAVWLNSSLGLLTLLARRTSTRAGWTALKKADLKRMPILDTQALSAEQLEGIAALFDELSESEFQRLPEMVDCPTRSALDDGLSKILGLPKLDGLRRLMASEPVISNRRL